MRAWLIGWRHKTKRCCKIQRSLGLRTKQWRTSFCDFWRVISRQKKLSRTRFMVISLSLHLYFAFLRKTVGKKNVFLLYWRFLNIVSLPVAIMVSSHVVTGISRLKRTCKNVNTALWLYCEKSNFPKYLAYLLNCIWHEILFLWLLK